MGYQFGIATGQALNITLHVYFEASLNTWTTDLLTPLSLKHYTVLDMADANHIIIIIIIVIIIILLSCHTQPHMGRAQVRDLQLIIMVLY